MVDARRNVPSIRRKLRYACFKEEAHSLGMSVRRYLSVRRQVLGNQRASECLAHIVNDSAYWRFIEEESRCNNLPFSIMNRRYQKIYEDGSCRYQQRKLAEQQKRLAYRRRRLVEK